MKYWKSFFFRVSPKTRWKILPSAFAVQINM